MIMRLVLIASIAALQRSSQPPASECCDDRLNPPIDTTNFKRAWVIVPGICVVGASALILLSQNFWIVAGSQIATAIAGAAIVPAVTGITLGIVRQRGFNRQIGRNQAFNHAGNMVGAALSGYLGWTLGYTAVFGLAAAFGIVSVICVLMIPAAAIDHRAAAGKKVPIASPAHGACC